ncbi:hypothetical protein [Streptomyces sp. GZWMJZ-114]|uniref:hypothetical protein n=1 Tax=unclassified Streptomyces TaxID=2593676 RepID=UPI001F50D328|nr:hypothetical protein [Streptomyces sp. GZWMJZ-114]
MRDDHGVGGGSGRSGAGEGDPARIALDWRQSAALVDTVPGADAVEEWTVTATAGRETVGAMTVYRLRLDAPSGRSPALDLEDWDDELFQQAVWMTDWDRTYRAAFTEFVPGASGDVLLVHTAWTAPQASGFTARFVWEGVRRLADACCAVVAHRVNECPDHARGPWASRAPGERPGLPDAVWEEAGFVPMKGGWVLDARRAWSG